MDRPTAVDKPAKVEVGQRWREQREYMVTGQVGDRWQIMFDYEKSQSSATFTTEEIRLPKPEPWRPSVDEFDLLPDAGT